MRAEPNPRQRPEGTHKVPHHDVHDERVELGGGLVLEGWCMSERWAWLLRWRGEYVEYELERGEA